LPGLSDLPDLLGLPAVAGAEVFILMMACVCTS
jgi:hypothetical protein